ncbi:CRISPR-associated endonuclease Cas2 [Persephonella sp.]
MKYLVTYDVADHKRRNKLFKFLLGYGINVELSVFEIVVSQEVLKEVIEEIKNIINPSEDAVFIFPYTGEVLRNGIYRGKNYGDIFV